jgi:TolA-binding protein
MLTPKKKLSRREIKEDKLVTAWLKATNWLEQHLRELSMAVGGVVVVVGLIVLFNWMKARDEQNASEKLAQARAEYNKSNYAAAIDSLEKLVLKFGGTKSGNMATIYLANACMQTKNYVDAEKYFQKYLDDGEDDPILKVSAAAGVAAAQEERGEFAKAAKLYEEAANDYDESYRAPQLLLLAARSYKQANQTEAARRVLQKLIDKYPQSSLVEDAKMLMAETGQASS